MDTIQLVNGYGRTNKPKMSTFKVLTLADVIAWSVPKEEPCSCKGGFFDVTANDPDHASRLAERLGYPVSVGQTVSLMCTCNPIGVRYRDITPSHVWFISQDGKARQAKVNGKVRTWKRDANRVELPLKYGMYEYATFTARDINAGRLLELIG